MIRAIYLSVGLALTCVGVYTQNTESDNMVLLVLTGLWYLWLLSAFVVVPAILVYSATKGALVVKHRIDAQRPHYAWQDDTTWKDQRWLTKK